jgi:hypothetical protein
VTGPVCGWTLDDGNCCAVQVEATGKLCGDHRRVEAAAKAVAARAAHARARPAPPGLPVARLTGLRRLRLSGNRELAFELLLSGFGGSDGVDRW